MKIAYVAWIPVAEGTGVLKKVAGQLRAWRNAGHEVALFVLGRASELWAGARDLDVRLFTADGTLSWFVEAERLVSAVLAWQPDVVYHRFGVHFPAIERLLRARPTVVELNALDVPEYRASLSRLRFGYHMLTRGRIFGRTRGFIAVTDEIGRSVGSYRRPTLVLGNGIDLADVEHAPPSTGPRPRLLFMGVRPQERRFGLDKLVRLAQACPDFDFDVVGAGAEQLPKLPANVTAHGFLERAKYRQLIARADVGVGTLALHRDGMREACPLKTREYLAAGLAVISAYRDPDFPPGTPFVLELANEEDNVLPALGRVTDFVRSWHGKRVDRGLVAELDTSRKESKRLAFMTAVAASGG